ncbi:MAG: aminotransferase class V-fold PLP-dependent enzyme [Oscillospiraceae bacterium]|nr:aminotransferase class V-fold PLP-dependent enzyme [Oscillospiraceae bacterium]MDD3832632.1 aminotransferase class V-fold PLP-dependent enzyme [Oscillospiraceae bacterium]MDD4546195.1 aminotransferase class V-fold PLP-dependent enzyme [Oscillospiraceae bacterium]
MSESAPFYSALLKYATKERASFHTPGHKGHAGLLEGLTSLTLDLTELPDTADLFGGGDAIEQAEKLASQAFGSALTLFSSGGCTLCIQTMLLLCAGGGGRVIFARNCHRSAVNAAAILGITPVWVMPTGNKGQVTEKDIRDILKVEADISAVYITSPDYYGNLADISAISGLCRAAGAKLLVDNAHGGHLGAFGLHPLALGADMTADSSHKTLPVLTGGAMLHIGRAGEPCATDRQTAKAAMSMFGSTSPSFIILASLDLARDWWQRAGIQAYGIAAESVAGLEQLATREGISVCSGGLRDPSRLTLDTSILGIDGMMAAKYFREQGCEPEYSDGQYVVFIITPFNTPDEIQRLRATIKGLTVAFRRGAFWRPGKKRTPPDYNYAMPLPEAAMPPREALLAGCETVDADHAVGRIAARSVCPCPPGIAVVVPGEIIDAQAAEKLKLFGFERLVVVK